jgi:membrane carboxypeptidase/penicillin-binding protein
VHWTPAIVTEVAGRKGGLRVGLTDGRVLPLTVRFGRAESALKLYDVVYVKLIDGSKKNPVRAELRVPPTVQGAAIVLENKTGKILAVTGGFSYPLSQLNRATQAQRQPLIDQAADLPDCAAGRLATQCADPGRADHVAADRWRPGEGLLDAEEL